MALYDYILQNKAFKRHKTGQFFNRKILYNVTRGFLKEKFKGGHYGIRSRIKFITTNREKFC